MSATMKTSSDLKDLAARHLNLALQPIRRVLQIAVTAQKKMAAQLLRHDVTPLCVSDDQVAQLLAQVDAGLCFLAGFPAGWRLNDTECRRQEELRFQAGSMGQILPLDAMAEQLALDDFERAALLLCLAPELHRAYGRILAYIHDDLNCQWPTIGMLCSLFSGSDAQWLANRRALSAHGRLRRLGLIRTAGDTVPESQLVCRPAPGVLERLCGADSSLGRGRTDWRDQFFDTNDLPATPLDFAIFPQGRQLETAARALGEGQVDLVALWGGPAAGVAAAVRALAAVSGKPLRKLPIYIEALPGALAAASYLEALLWVDCAQLLEDDNRSLPGEVVAHLVQGATPLILSGHHPWRPTELLARRNYYEIQLSAPGEPLRAENWRRLMPSLPQARALTLAQRFRLDPLALVAAQRVAEIEARLNGHGPDGASSDHLDQACGRVAQVRAGRFTQTVTPRRGPQDLVLPSELHGQVLEVAAFYKTLPLVDGDWGFGRLATGAGGIKALFTGDSGTGKTLAAEVIAGQIGLPMLKIDLSQLVSKWVGETEKNIDAAFCEAEVSHAILFFDEADTLFGKRGEIQQGSDRYANLEVGYLLQRLEQFPGLAVLASNLKDEIDEGFIRRFQVILHFPRPRGQERLRLWQMGFPPAAPLDRQVDLSTLTHLDMTGAAIFNACHTAALLAAREGSDTIGRRHIVAGITRQYHRESRVIGPSDLNRFFKAEPLYN